MTAPPAPSIRAIQEAVAGYFGLRPLEMTSRRAAARVAQPRQIAMYLARELTRASTPEIGREFDRDHSTVLHACWQVETRAGADAKFAAQLEDCRSAILHGPAARPDALAAVDGAIAAAAEQLRLMARSNPLGVLRALMRALEAENA